MRTVENRCENEDRNPILRELTEVLENVGFGLRIHRGGGLIQHQDVRARAHECPGERDLLPLATGKLAAVLEPLAELRLVTRR